MILHTSNGFEYDSTKPMRVSFVLRYAGDNPQYYKSPLLEYKAKKDIVMDRRIFRYAENIPHGSATFLYESKVGLGKSEAIFLDRSTTSNIDVEENRSLESQSKIINLTHRTQLLRKSSDSIDKNPSPHSLRLKSTMLWKNPISQSLKSFPRLIEGHKNILLASGLIDINKATQQSFSIPLRNIEVEKPKEVIPPDILEMQKVNETQGLNTPLDRPIVIEQPKEVLDLENLKDIVIKQGINVHRDNLDFIDIEHLKPALLRDSLKLGDKAKSQFMQIVKSFGSIEKYIASRYMHRENLHTRQNIVITQLLKKIKLRLMDKNRTQMLKRVNLKSITKDYGSKLYKRLEIKNITKNTPPKLVVRNNLVKMFKDNFNKGGGRKVITSILKYKERYFKHILLRIIDKPSMTSLRRYNSYNIDKSESKSFRLRKIIPIWYKQPRPVKTEILVPIDKVYNFDLSKLPAFNIDKFIPRGVIKDKILPITMDESKRLNKLALIDIYQCTETKFIDIPKRWWVIPPGTDVDYKILPCDYDYYVHPLLGSPRLGYTRVVFPEGSNHDKVIKDIAENMKVRFYLKNHYLTPYEYLPKLYDQHPNAPNVNPYIEHDDRGRGLYEMPLAINIMMEMVNLVGLIVHHQASQLCYCTGQEAMWFIMEMIDDWLNMDTTVQQLNYHKATEHYYRAYRWIRLEAEKVYFNCEASDRFQGLKAAGRLLANLIAYMKNHHFDIVPMWKNLSKMDYWRNQSNRDNNPIDDLPIILDKSKGPRHTNIETQRLDKKATEGMPPQNN